MKFTENMLKYFVILNIVCVSNVIGDAGTDYNEVNSDGSFSFGLSNDDIGGHYHTATGSPNKIIRGRYGSRNPDTGRIEETVYTAGPRGFRARGPSIHRRMDLSQYPPCPIGTPDDPLADPCDDPSYDFNFRTSEYERREDADSTGRVKGLYSYLDDIGERHTVRYAAGAGTGFEVLNAVPDTPASVAYNSPLYKAPRRTRGKMSVQRGPDGQYRFILSGPDQRRSETSGPDGIVRGSYSYLDDKGIQRTVQYIAGPGIGYRVVKNLIGPGTHVAAGAALPPTYGARDYVTNDISDDGYLRTAESGRIRPKDDSLDSLNNDKDTLPIGPSRRPSGERDFGNLGSGRNSGRRRPETSEGRRTDIVRARDRTPAGDYARDFSSTGGSRKEGSAVVRGKGSLASEEESRESSAKADLDAERGTEVSSETGADGRDRTSVDRTGYANGYEYSRGIGDGRKPAFSSKDYDDDSFGRRLESSSRNRGYDDKRTNKDRESSGGRKQKPSDRGRVPEDDFSGSRTSSRRPADRVSDYERRTGGSRNNNFDEDDYDFPLVTVDRRRLESDRNKDWSTRGRDSTVIKNVGKWYVGLPPGSAVRAHVQSIDLLPLGGRAVAPSEALLRDELKAT